MHVVGFKESLHQSSLRSIFGAALIAIALLLASSNQTIADDDAKAAALRDYNATAALQNSGLYKRAAERWQDFLGKYPNHEWAPRAKYYLGICRLHEKEFPAAVAQFEEVLAKYPEFKTRDGAQFNLGMALYQLAVATPSADAFGKAAAALNESATKYPDSSHIGKSLYYAGESLYNAGKMAEAVSAWQKLVARGETNALTAEAAYSAAVALEELKKPTEANAALKLFAEKFPQHEYAAEVHLRRGMLLFQEKTYAEADKEFASAASNQSFPHADFAALRQAQCQLELKETDKARELLETFIKDRANSPYKTSAQLALGKTNHLAGKSDQAVSLLQEAAKNESLAGEATWWLSRALLKLKKPADALAAVEKAPAAAKQGEFAPYLEFARLEAMQELPDKQANIAQQFEQFASKFADHPMAVQAAFLAALQSLNNEQYADARKQADAFLANGKFANSEFTATILFISGEAHLLGDRSQGASLDTAEKRYRELATKFPEHEKAAPALVRVGWALLEQQKYAEATTLLQQAEGKVKAPEKKAELFLLKGRSLAAQNKHAEAATAYDAGLAAAPKWSRSDETLLAAADSLLAEKKLDDAKKRIDQLRRDFSGSPLLAQAEWRFGDIARQQKNYDQAATSFQKAISLKPEKLLLARALYSLASVEFAQQKFEQAKQTIDKLLAEAGDAEVAADAKFLRGLAQKQLKRFKEAAEDITAYLATEPSAENAVDARYALALCRVGAGDNAAAITELEKLASNQADSPRQEEILYELGHAYLVSKDSAKAAATFEKLIERTPQSDISAEAWFHIGSIREPASDIDASETEKPAVAEQLASAAEAFEQGLEAAKSPALREKLQHKLGFVLLKQEKFPAAAAQLETQLKEHPQGELAAAAAFFAGEAYFRANDSQKALPLLEQAIELKVEKNLANAYYRAGAAAAAAGKWPESHDHYQALLEKFSDFPSRSDAQYGIGLALFKQGKNDDAKKAFSEVTDNSEAGAKSFFMRGEMAFEEKKYEEAVEHFLYVASGYPYDEWKGLARFEAARCLIELKKKQQAVQLLESFVQKQPQHAKANDAKTLLQDLQP